jgi:hypothetical protein
MDFRLNSVSLLLSFAILLVTIFYIKPSYSYPQLNHERIPRDVNGSDGAIVNPAHKCKSSSQRYHKENNRCYKAGTKGPCGDNMLFYAYQTDHVYGDCDCSHLSKIPLIFNVNTSKCYEVYQQSNCPENQWLVYDKVKENEVICEERKCPLSEKKIVFYKDQCVELFVNDKTNPCMNRAEQVRFPPGEFHPRCAPDNNSGDYNIGAPTLKCPPGHSRDIVGVCRQKIKFSSNGSKTQVQ